MTASQHAGVWNPKDWARCAGEMLIDQGDTTDASAHTTTSKVDAGAAP